MKTKNKIVALALLLISTIGLNAQEIDYANYIWDFEPSFESPKVEGDLSEVILKNKRVLEYVFEPTGFFQYDLSHQVIYIASEAGVEDNNKVYLSTAGDEQVIYQRARVVNSKGEIIEFDDLDIEEGVNEESGYSYKYFALDGLDIGSFVELIFLIKKADMYNGVRTTFQGFNPTMNIEFDLIAPDGLFFAFNSLNGFPEVKFDTTLDEKNYWDVLVDSIPAYQSEEMSYSTPNLQGVIYKLTENQYSGARDITSYGEVAKSYYDFCYNSLSKKDKKAIKKLIKSIGITDDMSDLEKIQKFEHHLKENYAVIDYVPSEFANIKALIKNKASNGSTFNRLYASALKEMEIKHQIVLTTDRTNLRFDQEFEAYNYLQSTLFYLPNENKYLDPTESSYRLGFISAENTNNYGLFIRELKIGDITSGIGKIKFIKPLASSESQNNHFVKVDMTVDPFEPEIAFEQHMSGYYSTFLQTSYSQLSEDEKERVNESLVEMVTMEKNEAEIELENATAEDFGYKPLILKTTVSSLKFTEKAADKIIFKVGELIGAQSELYNDKPREHAVESSFNREYIRKIEVALPQDYDVSNLEKLAFDVALEDGTAFFKSSYKVENNVLIIEVSEIYSRINFSLEEFEDYKRVVNAAADFNKVVIYLTKKA